MVPAMVLAELAPVTLTGPRRRRNAQRGYPVSGARGGLSSPQAITEIDGEATDR
jgi:hypothetical protein